MATSPPAHERPGHRTPDRPRPDPAGARLRAVDTVTSLPVHHQHAERLTRRLPSAPSLGAVHSPSTGEGLPRRSRQRRRPARLEDPDAVPCRVAAVRHNVIHSDHHVATREAATDASRTTPAHPTKRTHAAPTLANAEPLVTQTLRRPRAHYRSPRCRIQADAAARPRRAEALGTDEVRSSRRRAIGAAELPHP